jgi:putative phosphoesterase
VFVRVCLLADTHGSVDPRVLSVAASCDHCLHAGDVGADTVLQALRAVVPSVVAVRGNNDVPAKWPVSEHGILATLPPVASLELPGGILATEHGDRANPASVRHARLRGRHPAARAVVYGHSHRLVVDRQSRPWVLNPGAAGRSRTYGGPSCLVLTASSRHWAIETCRFPPG